VPPRLSTIMSNSRLDSFGFIVAMTTFSCAVFNLSVNEDERNVQILSTIVGRTRHSGAKSNGQETSVFQGYKMATPPIEVFRVCRT
jgi:hypothetical protein